MSVESPLILALDTATPYSGVAITRGNLVDGKVVGSIGLGGNISHSRKLLAAIDYLMEKSQVSWSDLSGIGVSLGPGSFTGLRIGMATAKGLCVASNLPLYGASTLDCLAIRCTGRRLVCSVLDARKKEVYYRFYRPDEQGLLRGSGPASVGSPEECAELIEEEVCMVGDGAVQYRDRFHQLLGPALQLGPAPLHEPSAICLAMLCGEQYQLGTPQDVGLATPQYIRRSDAELNLLKKQQQSAVVKAQS